MLVSMGDAQVVTKESLAAKLPPGHSLLQDKAGNLFDYKSTSTRTGGPFAGVFKMLDDPALFAYNANGTIPPTAVPIDLNGTPIGPPGAPAPGAAGPAAASMLGGGGLFTASRVVWLAIAGIAVTGVVTLIRRR